MGRQAPLSSTVVRLRHAGFVTPAGPVFEDVDLSIGPSEVVGIVGPSGGGKTTLVRTVLGLTEPTYGAVERLPGLRVGYVPQRDNLLRLVPLTVREALAMPVSGRPRFADHEHSRRMLRRLGLDGIDARHLASLSGGERRRVEIARAFAGRPDLVVLDEPASSLDAAARADLVDALCDLRDVAGARSGQAPTIVVVTHDVNGVAARLPRLVAFDRTVVADGPPHEVLHPYVLERTFGVRMSVIRRGERVVVIDPGPARSDGPP